MFNYTLYSLVYYLIIIGCVSVLIPDHSKYQPTIISAEDPTTNVTISINMQPGVSVRKELIEYCKIVPVDKCEMIIDYFNSIYFGGFVVPYKDTQPYDDIFVARGDVILYLQEAFNYQSYLEIGCDTDTTFSFARNIFSVAIGVDPSQGGTHRMTSDEFFLSNEIMFDIIFIDGLHTAEQVAKDINNALRFLNPGGTIVMHDCNPTTRKSQSSERIIDEWRESTGCWNGDAWRAVLPLRTREDLEVVVGDFDHGVGVIRRKINKIPLPIEHKERILNSSNPLYTFTYEEFDKNRLVLHHLLSFDELKQWILDDIIQSSIQSTKITNDHLYYYKDVITIHLQLKYIEENDTILPVVDNDLYWPNYWTVYNITTNWDYHQIIDYSMRLCSKLKEFHTMEDTACELLTKYHLKKVYYQRYVLNNYNNYLSNDSSISVIMQNKYSFCSYITNAFDIESYSDVMKSSYLNKTFALSTIDDSILSSEMKVFNDIINHFSSLVSIIRNICVIHSTTIEPSNHRILIELLDSITTSGLISILDYMVVINYGYEVNIDIKNKYPKIMFLQITNDLHYFEIPTLRIIQQLSQYFSNNDKAIRPVVNILYMHTLGNNYKEIINKIEKLRTDLITTLITNYQDVLQSFQTTGYDCIGSISNNNQHYSHFIGNYWWCKSSYISNLSELPYESNSEIEPQYWLFHSGSFLNINSNETEIYYNKKEYSYCLKSFQADK